MLAMRSCLGIWLLWLAGCAGSPGQPGMPNQFVAATPSGNVIVRVDGTTTGFTNSKLTELIADGMAVTYPVTRASPQKVSPETPLLVWHVSNDGRHPTAVVVVKVIRNGSVRHSRLAFVVAPGVHPTAAFLSAVADLAADVAPDLADAHLVASALPPPQ